MKKKYKIHSTIGNLNNHIGVPLTLLSAPFDTEILIIEMGANHIGEIATLCTIANPNYGIITNIGKAHLEGFGSLKGVIKAKTELYKYLSKNNGCVFYNEDNNILNEIVKKLKVNKVSYGSSKNASYPGRLISASPFLEFAIKLNVNNELSIKTKLIGGYNYENAMAAAAIGQFFHVPIEDIKETIENYEPVNNRSQLVEKDSNIILCDYYNANPTSMEKALINFAQLDSKGKKKILIIGEMKELGKDSKFEHQNIIKLIDDLGFENVLIIGNEYHNFCHPPYMFFDNNDKCKEFLLTNKITNSIVLIKGSRGAKLEEIFEIL